MLFGNTEWRENSYSMFENMMILGNERESNADFLPVFPLDNTMDLNEDDLEVTLPLIALKNTVLFPGVVIPITVGRDKSLKAISESELRSKALIVVAQRDSSIEDPETKDLYDVGVLANVMKVLKMPDGSTTTILQGKRKVKIKRYVHSDPYFEVEYDLLQNPETKSSLETDALLSSIRDEAKKIIEMSPNIPSEAVMMLENIKEDHFLIDFIASNLNVKTAQKQDVLETMDLVERATIVFQKLNKELQLLQLKNKIESKVKGDIEKQQRDYFLNQQLRTIQEELGGSPQEMELKELENRAKDKKWTDKIKKHFHKELKKASRINPQVAEYSVILNYLETFLDLPWENYTEDNFDLNDVKKILDADHHGLEDVKKRILEHLAVLKLKGDMKAPILCLVGPPGVGKTSLGRSIGKALGRKFVRMSLGGLHDESEIRGHRKTYIGAMPGRIIKSLKKLESSNPVFILDEIDKLGKGHRGDPSSALLEVLDPEQNSTFYDNYLEVEYDLSKVLFIATANSLNSIQPALLDRMEVIQIAGYSTEEKVAIAKKHLVPKQRKSHGVTGKDVSLSDAVLKKIIGEYTKEAGVRGLERTIGSVMRNVAMKKAMDTKYDPKLSKDDVQDILGPIKYNVDKLIKIDTHGVVIGLAWTRVGGDILFIETSTSKGKGKLNLTGNLGDVMKESATTALSYIRANAKQFKVDPEIFDKVDIHIHVPEGAIPKDGPSAGITMLTAITSALTKKKVKQNLAMTGEITLRGKVLPVGGIKEKVLAAKRVGVKTIILCEDNKRHVEQIEERYIKGLEFKYVSKMEEVIAAAF